MNSKHALLTVCLVGMVLALVSCRDDTEPPDRFNENLAEAGQPALLPMTPHSFAGDVRGRLVRMDREERKAAGENSADGEQPSNPDVDEVTGLISDFNRLVQGGDYASVAELVLAEQKSDAMQYWSQLGELSLAMREALSQTTEAVGASRPELMPQVETLKGTVDRITVRGIVSPVVEVAGDEAVATVEAPAPPGLAPAEDNQVRLRRGPDGWRFVAAVPEDGNIEDWLAPLRAALAATETAVNEFDSAQIDAETLVARLTAAAAAAVPSGGASETTPDAPTTPPEATTAPADAEAPPAEPSAPPTAGGPGGLVP